MEDPGTFADWDKEYAAKFRCMAVWIDQHMATGVCAPTTGAATTADSAALMWRTLASKSELDTFDSHLPSHPISDVHGRTAAVCFLCSYLVSNGNLVSGVSKCCFCCD